MNVREFKEVVAAIGDEHDFLPVEVVVSNRVATVIGVHVKTGTLKVEATT